jgi:uncharacterized protein involved in exopolysaccharide biosynthesis
MSRPTNLNPPTQGEVTPRLIEYGPAYEEDDTIDLFELIATLLRYKYLILLITILAPVLAYGVLQFIPKQYTATTTFIQVGGEGGSNRLAQFGALASLAGVNLPDSSGGEQLSSKIEVILKSREFARQLVNEMQLMPLLFPKLEEMQASEDPPTDVDGAGALLEAIVFEETKEGAQSIAVTLLDPEYAAFVANSSLKSLEQYLRENTLTSSQKNLVFIEQQLNKAEADLRKAEEKLRAFVLTNKSYLLSSQTEIIGRTLGELEVRKATTEVEQQVMRQFRSGDSPQIQQMSLGNVALSQEIERLQGNLDQFVARYGDVQFDEAFLKKELEVYQEIYKQFRISYENQKLEVEKEATLFKVIDPALVPELPSKPKSRLILALSVVVGGFFSIFLVFFIDFIRNNRHRLN